MTIGDRIRLYREQKGISISKLAKESGLSKSYLSALERKKADNPSVEALRRLAEALGVQPPDLLEESATPASGTTRLPPGLKAFLEEREKAGKPLSADDVEMLRTIRFRGKRPRTPADFAYLYETIRRIVE